MSKKFLIKQSFTILFLLLFSSCSYLTPQSSNEYTVTRKSPLIMPPDYKELPEPNQNKMNSSDKDNNIKKLVTNKDNTVTNEKKTKQTNKKLEESLIEKIKKN